MSLRIPISTVLDYNDSGNTGATSIVSKTFTLPQDTDEVILKVPITSIVGTAPVVDVFLQTTDDGGTTWYDVANIRPTQTVVASTINIVNAAALFASAATTTTGIRTNNSVTGATQASSLGANQYSGLPLLSQFGRVSIKYSGTIATNDGVRIQVKTNNQSNRA